LSQKGFVEGLFFTIAAENKTKEGFISPENRSFLPGKRNFQKL